MRVLSVLLLTAALAASAGCFGKGGDDTPTDTTPTPTGPATSTPTTTPTTTPTVTPSPAAPPPAKDLCTVTKDFSSQQPTPPETTVTTTGECGEVAMGYTKIVLSGNWTGTAPIPLQSGASVVLLDPAGTAVATCTAPSPPTQLPAECTPIEAVATMGAYTLEFHGGGAVSFSGVVHVS